MTALRLITGFLWDCCRCVWWLAYATVVAVLVARDEEQDGKDSYES